MRYDMIMTMAGSPRKSHKKIFLTVAAAVVILVAGLLFYFFVMPKEFSLNDIPNSLTERADDEKYTVLDNSELPDDKLQKAQDSWRDLLIKNQREAGVLAGDAEPVLSSKKFVCHDVDADTGYIEFNRPMVRHCYVKYIDVITTTKSFSEISQKESTAKFNNLCGSFELTISVDGRDARLNDRMVMKSAYVSFYGKDDALPTSPVSWKYAEDTESGKYLPKVGDYRYEQTWNGYESSYDPCAVPSTTATDLQRTPHAETGFGGRPFFERGNMSLKIIRDFPHKEGSIDGFYGDFTLADGLNIDKTNNYVVNVYEYTYKFATS